MILSISEKHGKIIHGDNLNPKYTAKFTPSS